MNETFYYDLIPSRSILKTVPDSFLDVTASEYDMKLGGSNGQILAVPEILEQYEKC